MTTITFPRPTKALLSMNDRHHWRRKSADVRAWRWAASTAAERHHGPVTDYWQPPSTVVVTLDVPTKARRDPANYFATVKPIVDGLVDAACWRDDTPEWVTVVEPVLRHVGTKASLMVEVTMVPR